MNLKVKIYKTGIAKQPYVLVATLRKQKLQKHGITVF